MSFIFRITFYPQLVPSQTGAKTFHRMENSILVIHWKFVGQACLLITLIPNRSIKLWVEIDGGEKSKWHETLFQYINSFDEVMSGDSYDYEVVYGTKIIEKVLKVDDMVSDVEVIELNPKSRKCLFKTEPQTNYFDVSNYSIQALKIDAENWLKISATPQTYTINLCKMGCRINQALRICRCVPFFYAVKNVRVCGIDGMICLANITSWYDTSNCKCPSLCEAVFLTKIFTKEVIATC